MVYEYEYEKVIGVKTSLVTSSDINTLLFLFQEKITPKTL